MPTTKNFELSFNPVEKQKSGFWAVVYSLADPSKKRQFSATTLKEARKIVDAAAAEYGKPCHASLESLDGREPAGFRKEFTFKSLYYNLRE